MSTEIGGNLGESMKQSKRKMGFIHLPRKYLARAFHRLDSIEDRAGNKTKRKKSLISGSFLSICKDINSNQASKYSNKTKNVL